MRDAVKKWILKINELIQIPIRYFLAFVISIYGASKIFHLQFGLNLYQLDKPLKDLSGFELAWFYYGYSYQFAFILGLTQLIGSFFLLFKRTTLLGVFILLPVLVNIVLVNIYYSIGDATLQSSLIFTALLVFLLLQHFKKLKALLWDTQEKYTIPFPPRYKWFAIIPKNILRILILIFPIYLSKHSLSKVDKSTPLNGYWDVTSVKVLNNNKTALDKNYTKINAFIFEPRGSGHHCLVKTGDKYVSTEIKLNSNNLILKHTDIEAISTGPAKIEFKKVSNFNQDAFFKGIYTMKPNNTLLLNGIIGKDSLQISLLRKDIH